MSPFKAIKPAQAKLIPSKAKVTAPAERKSRRKFDFTLEQLRAVSHLRQDDAAGVLKCAPITLKRNCKRYGYRWPYRGIKAQRHREEAAKAKALNPRTSKKKAPTSPSSVQAPELLLMLSRGKKQPVNSSPTSVSGLSSPVSTVRSPKPRFPLVNTAKAGPSPLLPPLTWLLQQRQYQSTPVNALRPMLHRPVDHRSSFYAASFTSSAPTFPARLTTLLNQCENERRLAELSLARFPRHLCVESG
jgi:hypothetical protein